MNTLRYLVAVWSVAFMPPAILFWFAVHPFVGFWRRVGVARTYWVLVPAMLVMAAAIVAFRDPIMAVDYGFHWEVAGPGIALFLLGMVFDKRAKDHLKFKTLAGVPELRGDGQTGKLLTEGIYARVRHPRYTGVTCSTAGMALITNYLAMYALALFAVLGVYAITVFEERELLERFGEEYGRYRARVPRFIPGPRRSGSAAETDTTP